MTAPEAEQRRLQLPPRGESAAAARAFVASALDNWGLRELVADARVVASELVTNAVLHARSVVDLVVERLPDGVRLEVHDQAPGPVLPPVSVPAQRGRSLLEVEDDLEALEAMLTADATTGRGLRLVDGLATNWGVSETPNGKAVWAVLRPAITPQRRRMTPTEPAEVSVATGRPVRLIAVPVRLALESDLQLDALIREFQVIDAGNVHAAQASALVAAAREIVDNYAPPRRAGQQALRAALERADRLVDANLLMPEGAVDAVRQLTRLLDEVATYCDRGELLALAPTAELRAFREWYGDEIARQIGGLPPRPCPFPVVADPIGLVAGSADQLDPATAATVDRIGAQLLAQPDPSGITRALLAEAVGALGAGRSSVCLVVPGDEQVEIVDSLGYPEAVSEHWARFPLSGDLPASEAIRIGRPVVLRTLAERDTRYPVFRGTPVVQDPSLVCVPFPTRGRHPLGCLVLGFANARDFSPHDLALLEKLCDYAGRALDAVAEDAERRRSDELRAIAQRLAAEVADVADADEILRRLAHAVAGELAEWCSIHVLGPDGEPRFVAAAHEDPEKTALAEEFHTTWPPQQETSAIARCLRDGTSVVFQVVPDDVLTQIVADAEQLALLRQIGLGSGAVLPIRAGRIVAALAVANSPGRYVTDVDLRFLDDLTRRVGSRLAAMTTDPV